MLIQTYLERASFCSKEIEREVIIIKIKMIARIKEQSAEKLCAPVIPKVRKVINHVTLISVTIVLRTSLLVLIKCNFVRYGV